MTPKQLRSAAHSHKNCPFCARIENGEHDAQDAHAVTFEPLNPVTPGHRLFVPKTHVTPLDSPLAIAHTIPLLNRWRAHVGARENYNVIVNAGPDATQTVAHLHVHYVPRRTGDGLTLPWTDQKRNHQ